MSFFHHSSGGSGQGNGQGQQIPRSYNSMYDNLGSQGSFGSTSTLMNSNNNPAGASMMYPPTHPSSFAAFTQFHSPYSSSISSTSPLSANNPFTSSSPFHANTPASLQHSPSISSHSVASLSSSSSSAPAVSFASSASSTPGFNLLLNHNRLKRYRDKETDEAAAQPTAFLDPSDLPPPFKRAHGEDTSADSSSASLLFNSTSTAAASSSGASLTEPRDDPMLSSPILTPASTNEDPCCTPLSDVAASHESTEYPKTPIVTSPVNDHSIESPSASPSSSIDGEIDTDQWNLGRLRLEVNDSIQPLLNQLSSNQAKRIVGMSSDRNDSTTDNILRNIQKEFCERRGMMARPRTPIQVGGKVYWDKTDCLRSNSNNNPSHSFYSTASSVSSSSNDSPTKQQQSLVLYTPPKIPRSPSELNHMNFASIAKSATCASSSSSSGPTQHVPIVTEIESDEDEAIRSASPPPVANLAHSSSSSFHTVATPPSAKSSSSHKPVTPASSSSSSSSSHIPLQTHTLSGIKRRRSDDDEVIPTPLVETSTGLKVEELVDDAVPNSIKKLRSIEDEAARRKLANEKAVVLPMQISTNGDDTMQDDQYMAVANGNGA